MVKALKRVQELAELDTIAMIKLLTDASRRGEQLGVAGKHGSELRLVLRTTSRHELSLSAACIDTVRGYLILELEEAGCDAVAA